MNGRWWRPPTSTRTHGPVWPQDGPLGCDPPSRPPAAAFDYKESPKVTRGPVWPQKTQLYVAKNVESRVPRRPEGQRSKCVTFDPLRPPRIRDSPSRAVFSEKHLSGKLYFLKPLCLSLARQSRVPATVPAPWGGVLGRPGGVLGASWGRLGGLGAFWERLWRGSAKNLLLSPKFSAPGGRLGRVLGPSWESWGVLGASWGRLGDVPGRISLPIQLESDF